MIMAMEMPPLPGGLTAPGGKVEVFISFVHEDQEVAETVQNFIEAVLRVNTFVSCDKWAIFAGEHWLERIKNALESARVVVLLLSGDSMVRPWVNFEAGAAWLQGTVIIPVCFKNLKPSDLPKPYSSFQAIDFCGEMDDQYYLITSIAHHLGIIPPVVGDPPEAYGKLQQALADMCPPK